MSVLKKLSSVIIITFLYSNFVYASAKQENLKTYRKCVATKSAKVDPVPEHIAADNDITKSEGTFGNPVFEKIILRGIIRDKNCVPISNARFKVWQADAYGNKRYIPEFAIPDEIYEMDNKQYSKFEGTGRATSSNNGELFIITIKPSQFAKNKAPSYVNFKLNHDKFPDVENKIYLLEKNQSPKGKNDIYAKNYYLTEDKKLKIYDFEIVLDGVSKHSRY